MHHECPSSRTFPPRSSHQPPTALDSTPLTPLRTAFTHWIKTLPMEERFVAVKIPAPGLWQSLRLMFSESGPQDRSWWDEGKGERWEPMDTEKPTKPSKLEKLLFQSLIFVSDGHDFLDHLCFDYSLLECPERLFDVLTCNVKHEELRLMEEALNSKRNVENMVRMIGQRKLKELVLDELISVMRDSVLLSFRNAVTDPQRVSSLLEQERQRKKDFSIFWRNISLEHRMNLLLIQCKNIKGLQQHLEKEGIVVSEQQIQRQVQQLLLLQNNQFCNKIFKCRLRKSISPLLDYYRLVYLAWKKEVDTNKKHKYGKHRRERDFNSQHKHQQREGRRKHRNRKSNSVESNETNYTEHHEPIFADKSRSNDSLDKHQTPSAKVTCKEAQETQEDNNRGQAKVSKKTEATLTEQHLQIKSLSQVNKMAKRERQEHPICQTPPKKESYRLVQSQPRHKTTATYQLSRQAIIKASLPKLELQLEEISDQISEVANSYHERRVVAFQRMQFLMNYYSIPIKLFGSCANGIAVKDSDIDIAIDQRILANLQFIPETQKLGAALQSMDSLLSNYSTFKEIKLIKTAAIPVLKLTIDTSEPFLSPEYGQSYSVLNRSHNGGAIHADVTIQTANKQNQSSHLGIRTTNAISEWLASISSLRSLVIVMKSLLTSSKLNLAYEGGLNTFALIIMIVAYIQHKKLENQTNSAMILRSILHFYVEEFDQKEYGIDLLRADQSIYFKKEKSSGSPSKVMKADLEIMDPICQHKNMTRNCYLYPQIKQLFKTMLTTCFLNPEAALLQLAQQQLDRAEEVDWAALCETNKAVFAQRNVFVELQTTITT